MHKSNALFLFIIIPIIILSSIVVPTNFGVVSLNQSGNSNKNSSANTLTNDSTKIQAQSQNTYSSSQIKQIIGLQWLLDQGFDGKNVRIGFVDSGIKTNALSGNGTPIFGNRVIAQSIFLNSAYGYAGNTTSITPNINHGTETASIAAGSEYGMAPGSTLAGTMLYSGNQPMNGGYPGEETTADVVNAVIYLAKQNCTIINLSLGQYSNIVNDGRQYIIDKISKEKNIIFTISAANDGDSGIDGASIGTPGTSFQAITVAASDGSTSMASFSSSGIRSDYTIKPDLTAPGVGIPVNSFDYKYNDVQTFADGTSFSAPIVAGGIAVLIQALAYYGRNYTVGAIKAALIETANPIGNYPIWYQGAGMVNFTAAYQLLMSKPVNSITYVPTIATAFPKKLPIFPLDTMFTGQSVPFNLTVVSSNYDLAQITLHGIPANIMSFNSQQYFNNSERLSILFHPTLNTSPGIYTGYLLLSFTSGQTTNVTIQFTVKKPLIKVLFDETKNGFVNFKKPGSSPTYLDDPWGFSTFLLGQYRDFYHLLALNNISVTPFFKGSYTNLTYLKQFDTIIFTYPNSKVTNPFTDWYNQPFFNGLFTLTEPTLVFSQNELNTINAYIHDFSKSIWILTSDQIDTNATAFNSLLSTLGMGYKLSNPSVTLDNEPLSVNSSNEIFSNISSLDYYGTNFTSLNTDPNVESLENGRILVLDGYAKYNKTRGRIIVSGSGYFAENFMLDPSNHNYINDSKFVLNTLSWLKGYKPFLTYYIPSTYTEVAVVTQLQISTKTITESCFLQSAASNTNSILTICSESPSNSIFPDFVPFLLVMTVILLGYLEYRRRTKRR